MREKKSISYIIPAYNASNTLGRAIESILKTKNVLEIIVINDGSIDNTRDIIDHYAKNYDRVIAVHQENHGASFARSEGIRIARGEYLSFVDSDDFLSDDYDEMVDKFLETNDCDMCIFGYKKIVKNHSIGEVFFDDYEFCINEENTDYIEKLLKSLLFNHIWNKIYRTEILKRNQIIFDSKVTIGEDYMFNLDYIDCISKVKVLSSCVYNYVETVNGLTHKYYENKYRELTYGRLHFKNFIEKHKLSNRLYYDLIIKNIYSYSTNMSHSHSKLTYFKKVKNIREILKGQEIKSIWNSYTLFTSKRPFLTLLVRLRAANTIVILGRIRSIVERI